MRLDDASCMNKENRVLLLWTRPSFYFRLEYFWQSHLKEIFGFRKIRNSVSFSFMSHFYCSETCKI